MEVKFFKRKMDRPRILSTNQDLLKTKYKQITHRIRKRKTRLEILLGGTHNKLDSPLKLPKLLFKDSTL